MKLVDHSLRLRDSMQVLQLHQNQHREPLKIPLDFSTETAEITDDASILILAQLLIDILLKPCILALPVGFRYTDKECHLGDNFVFLASPLAVLFTLGEFFFLYNCRLLHTFSLLSLHNPLHH